MVTFLSLLFVSVGPLLCWLAVLVPVAWVLVRRYGAASLLAAGPLLDVVMAPPAVAWVVMPYRFSERISPGMLLAGTLMRFLQLGGVGTAVGIYFIGLGAILWLLSGKRFPEWILPVRGLWARKFLAGGALLAVLSAPLFLIVRTLGTSRVLFSGDSPAAAIAVVAVPALFVFLYLYPAWNVLVHGWQWTIPGSGRGPATGLAAPDPMRRGGGDR